MREPPMVIHMSEAPLACSAHPTPGVTPRALESSRGAGLDSEKTRSDEPFDSGTLETADRAVSPRAEFIVSILDTSAFSEQ